MARKEFEPNPFATSAADKDANLERVRAEREALDEVRGATGSDGLVLDGISKFGLGAMDATGQIVEGASDMLGDIGTGVVTAPGTLRGKIGGKGGQ